MEEQKYMPDQDWDEKERETRYIEFLNNLIGELSSAIRLLEDAPKGSEAEALKKGMEDGRAYYISVRSMQRGYYETL